MAVSDLCRVFGSEALPLMDVGGAAQPLKSLLSQLLLKVWLQQRMHIPPEACHFKTPLLQSSVCII